MVVPGLCHRKNGIVIAFYLKVAKYTHTPHLNPPVYLKEGTIMLHTEVKLILRLKVDVGLLLKKE